VCDINVLGTYRGVFVKEDFWFIVMTEGNEDETEIHEFKRSC
jgi:hypothetical protein